MHWIEILIIHAQYVYACLGYINMKLYQRNGQPHCYTTEKVTLMASEICSHFSRYVSWCLYCIYVICFAFSALLCTKGNHVHNFDIDSRSCPGQ